MRAVFLLGLAIGARVSKLHSFRSSKDHIVFHQELDHVTLYPNPEFFAKNEKEFFAKNETASF